MRKSKNKQSVARKKTHVYRRIFLSIFLPQLTTNLELTPKLCGLLLRLPIAIVIRVSRTSADRMSQVAPVITLTARDWNFCSLSFNNFPQSSQRGQQQSKYGCILRIRRYKSLTRLMAPMPAPAFLQIVSIFFPIKFLIYFNAPNHFYVSVRETDTLIRTGLSHTLLLRLYVSGLIC